MPNDDQPRNTGNGRYVTRTDTPDRVRRALDMRRDGMKYRDIATELGADVKTVHTWVKDALTSSVKESAQELLALEAERLDQLYCEAIAVLQRDHVTVSHGKVITVRDAETGREMPLLDDGPKLAAIDRLVKIRESYRKLHGLDAPSRVSVDAANLGEEIGDLLNQLTAGGSDDSTSA